MYHRDIDDWFQYKDLFERYNKLCETYDVKKKFRNVGCVVDRSYYGEYAGPLDWDNDWSRRRVYGDEI